MLSEGDRGHGPRSSAESWTLTKTGCPSNAVPAGCRTTRRGCLPHTATCHARTAQLDSVRPLSQLAGSHPSTRLVRHNATGAGRRIAQRQDFAQPSGCKSVATVLPFRGRAVTSGTVAYAGSFFLRSERLVDGRSSGDVATLATCCKKGLERAVADLGV